MTPNNSFQPTGHSLRSRPSAEAWRYRAEQSSAFLAGCKSLPGKG
jgi:hypothetical protein